jgi:hypothetical protein
VVFSSLPNPKEMHEVAEAVRDGFSGKDGI